MAGVFPLFLLIPGDSPTHPTASEVTDKNRAFVQGLAADVATSDPSKKITSLEALARMFESREISDDGTAKGRLSALRDVFARPGVAGAFLGLPGAGADPKTNAPTSQFDSSGFGKQFQDTESQPQHFLFALQATVDPSEYAGSLPGLLPDSLAAAATERLAVGHEQAPGNVTGAVAVIGRIWLAFWRPSSSDIEAFEKGDYSKITHFDGEPSLNQADLRLPRAGFELGELIRTGDIKTGGEAASWIREHLGQDN